MASLDAAFSYRPSDSAGAEDEVESDLDGKIGVFSEVVYAYSWIWWLWGLEILSLMIRIKGEGPKEWED